MCAALAPEHAESVPANTNHLQRKTAQSASPTISHPALSCPVMHSTYLSSLHITSHHITSDHSTARLSASPRLAPPRPAIVQHSMRVRAGLCHTRHATPRDNRKERAGTQGWAGVHTRPRRTRGDRLDQITQVAGRNVKEGSNYRMDGREGVGIRIGARVWCGASASCANLDANRYVRTDACLCSIRCRQLYLVD